MSTRDVQPRDDWPRQEFFAWLELAREHAGIKHDYELAQLAGINHSSISAWRIGRQRPSTRTLSRIAAALGVTAREVWLRAGAMAEADMKEAPVKTVDPDARGVEIIKSSTILSDKQKDHLIATYREDRRREREEAERQIRRTLELLETVNPQ